MPYEVSFILSVTEASFCFVENAVQLRKILNISENLPAIEHLIVMDREFTHTQRDEAAAATKIEILCYQDLVDEGRALLDNHAMAKQVESEREKGNCEEIATIIFTSGTTGDPKGVMLTHTNFAYQLVAVPKLIEKFAPGQRWLSVLPVWHSFERILQYVIIGNASTVAYSKPLGSILLADLAVVNPHWMGSVPVFGKQSRAGICKHEKQESCCKRSVLFLYQGCKHV